MFNRNCFFGLTLKKKIMCKKKIIFLFLSVCFLVKAQQVVPAAWIDDCGYNDGGIGTSWAASFSGQMDRICPTTDSAELHSVTTKRVKNSKPTTIKSYRFFYDIVDNRSYFVRYVLILVKGLQLVKRY